MKSAIIILFSIFIINTAFAQDDDSDKDMFNEAEFFFMNEDYRTAAYFYKKAFRLDTSNANFSYCLGLSYLQLPMKEKYAIAYLKHAIQKTSTEYKIGEYEEKHASIDAYRYLAEAYMRINKFDLAAIYYRGYIEKIGGRLNDVEMDFVNAQLASCNRALLRDSVPDETVIENMGDVVNSESNETYISVSGNDSVLVLVREVPVKNGDLQERDAIEYVQKVYLARRGPEGWSFEAEISDDLKLKKGTVPVSLSYDGNTILLHRDNEKYGDVEFDGGAIYFSEYSEKKGWSSMKKVGGDVNTLWNESYASLSMSGDTMYFASDRDGTVGGMDIFFAVKDRKGNWRDVQNLGDTINTKFNETSPFFMNNILYFSSEGHETYGGFDVFYAKKLDDVSWDAPRNLSSSLNSGFNEIGFVPVKDGSTGYMSLFERTDLKSLGYSDIFLISNYSLKSVQ